MKYEKGTELTLKKGYEPLLKMHFPPVVKIQDVTQIDSSFKGIDGIDETESTTSTEWVTISVDIQYPKQILDMYYETKNC